MTTCYALMPIHPYEFFLFDDFSITPKYMEGIPIRAFRRWLFKAQLLSAFCIYHLLVDDESNRYWINSPSIEYWYCVKDCVVIIVEHRSTTPFFSKHLFVLMEKARYRMKKHPNNKLRIIIYQETLPPFIIISQEQHYRKVWNQLQFNCYSI